MLSVTELRGMLGSGGQAATGAGTFSAVVTRVDADGTTWCQVDGSSTPTPCATDMACSVGDVVTVRIADHRATVTGNATSPATDDSTAIVAQSTAEVAQGTAKAAGSDASVARKAASAAARQASAANAAASEASALANATNQHFWQDANGASVTEQPQDEYVQQPTGWRKLLKSTGELLTHAVNGVERIFRSDTASGTLFFDGECAPDASDLEDHVVASFSKDEIRLGGRGSEVLMNLDSDSLTLSRATDLITHIGYDLTLNQAGEVVTGPFFILGRRYTTGIPGMYSLAEGFETAANGYTAHSEGYGTTASGLAAHAEGHHATASGQSSHAEGWNAIASGSSSHAEGEGTQATSSNAHAEGLNSVASGTYSHAEGRETVSSGLAAHAEGYSCQATSEASHAEGYKAFAEHMYAHVEGYETKSGNMYQHVEGKYNKVSNEYINILGGGTSDTNRFNLHATKFDGTQEVNERVDLPIFNYATLPAESSLPLKPCIVVLTTGEVYLAT